jgi:hypothetical protein
LAIPLSQAKWHMDFLGSSFVFEGAQATGHETGFESGKVFSPKEEIHEKESYGVYYDITHAAFPQGDEGLMILIGYGIKDTNDSGENKGLAGRQDRVEGPEEKKIKNSIFNNVGGFFEGEIERPHIQQG